MGDLADSIFDLDSVLCQETPHIVSARDAQFKSTVGSHTHSQEVFALRIPFFLSFMYCSSRFKEN